MTTNRQKLATVFTVLFLVASMICMFMANGIQRDHGNIKISEGKIQTDAGKITYKLYKPVSATKDNRAPGVLLLHGYQNDHETCRAYAIELARRGVVFWQLMNTVTVRHSPDYWKEAMLTIRSVLTTVKTAKPTAPIRKSVEQTVTRS